MINVVAAAQQRGYSPTFRDRSWLATELESLIAAAAWTQLGGLLAHVACAAAPVAGGLAAAVTTAQTQEPRTASPSWSDPAWIAAELRAHATALCAPDSSMQALALQACGAVARINL